MTKQEILNLLTERRLLKVIRDGRVIEYVDGGEVFYEDSFHNRKNVYGVYFNPKYNKYAFFITGEERGGIVDYFHSCLTEEEAYTAMYKYIKLLA